METAFACAQCEATSEDGIGWRGVLAVGDEDNEDLEEVFVFCPNCAARELTVASTTSKSLYDWLRGAC